MDGFTTTSDNLDQTDEAILTCTVSDEALEAAAGPLLAQTNTVSAYWLGDCRLHPCAIGLLAGGVEETHGRSQRRYWHPD
jgi:hypothetical protein